MMRKSEISHRHYSRFVSCYIIFCIKSKCLHKMGTTPYHASNLSFWKGNIQSHERGKTAYFQWSPVQPGKIKTMNIISTFFLWFTIFLIFDGTLWKTCQEIWLLLPPRAFYVLKLCCVSHNTVCVLKLHQIMEWELISASNYKIKEVKSAYNAIFSWL